MLASNQAIELIKKFEGLVQHVYKDAAGFKTIGYGHKLKPHESFKRVTVRQAEELLQRDVNDAVKAVLRNVNCELEQYELDALACFVFNIGEGAFSQSTLLKKINNGNKGLAANEFGRWIFAGRPPQPLAGLVRRRYVETMLYLNKYTQAGVMCYVDDGEDD